MRFDEYLANLLGKREKNKLIKAMKCGKVIVITGPHGPTGKTTLANVLRERWCTVYEKDLAVQEVSLTEPLKECISAFWRTVR